MENKDLKILNTIKSPNDVKRLSEDELVLLAKEVRKEMIETVSKTGGHLASNLGVIELTIALHKVFDSPKDKIVWDVGHQVYTHKMLTGRFDEFSTLRQEGGLSGFPNPDESVHDIFAAGHSGASVSAAYGLSVAEQKAGTNSYTIAVIGDGSFSGGLVFEALNNAGRSNTNLIVVLNDNEMSISKNVGSMAKYLAAIRTRPEYYKVSKMIQTAIRSIPFYGMEIDKRSEKAKKAIKNYLYGSTLFEDMGFRYMGPIDGHDIDSLCEALESAKQINYPVLLHIHTVKGKGYNFAEEFPARFHGISKFDIPTGEPLSGGDNFSSKFGESLCKIARDNRKVNVITAAMTLGTGLEVFAKQFPNRLFDVGIAEEHAVTFAGGLAKGGIIPVFAVYSTFLQRSYDEILHDVAMQHQKVVLGIDRAGFVGADGKSHQGLFDVAFLNTVPKATVYSPSSYEELDIDLNKAISEPGELVAVRYPRGKEKEQFNWAKPTGNSFDLYKSKSYKTTLVTYGIEFSNVCKAAEILKENKINVKILKLNRIVPIDQKAVDSLLKDEKVFFFEEGVKSGGAGEKMAAMLLESGYKGQYKITAVDNTFVSHASTESQLKKYGLDVDGIVKTVMESK